MERVLGVILGFAIATSAVGQNTRVVAVTGQPAPGQPTTNTFASMYAITLSPTGDVAFAAFGNSPNQSFRQGIFAERAGVLTRIADNTTLGTSQNTFLPWGFNAAGDVFFIARETLPSAAPVSVARLTAADGTTTDMMRGGWIAPSIPDRTLTGPPVDPVGLVPRRVLPDSRSLVLLLGMTPSTTPTGTSSSGLFRYTPQTGLSLEAIAGTSTNPALPAFTSVSWPEDTNNSGQAIARLTPSGGTAGYYLLTGTTITRVLGANDPIPGAAANVRVSALGPAFINDAGRVLVVVGDTTSTVRFFSGPPDNLQLIHSSGDVISSPTVTARPLFTLSVPPFLALPAALASDGTVVLFSSNTLYAPPSSGGGASIVAIAPDGSKRLLWNQREPVRMPDGSLELVMNAPVQWPFVASLGAGRVVWHASRLRSPLRTMICTFDEFGDPVAVLEGLTSVASPVGPLTLSALLQPGNTQFGDYSCDINDRGDIAVLTTATNAQGFTLSVALVTQAVAASCGDIDFNNNGVFPEDQDIIDFFDVLAGAPCPTLRCDTIDFNRNGAFPEDQDVIDFLNVLAGGTCGT